MIKKWFWILGVLFLVSCQQNRLKVDVKDIIVQLEINRYDQLIFETEHSNLIEVLYKEYDIHPDFIDLYFQDVLRIGKLDDQPFNQSLHDFVTDTVISQVAGKVLQQFADFSSLTKDLTSGFRHYQYYFPQKPVPAIYTYVSGFNQSLVFTDDFIGISLDNYLGSECVFYTYLGIPQYKIKNMYPQKMVSDLFYALALTEFPKEVQFDNLLSEMVYEGKLVYFTEAMCPELQDSILIGYSKQQLEWCKKNEALMWNFWAENKLLYSVERLDLQKYIGDAPFTNTFSQESPGRTGVWIGWQIVRSFMNKHPEITLDELMNNNNAQEILNQSGYFPE